MSYTLQDAVNLAHMLLNAPGAVTGPRPTLEEALCIITAAQRRMNCNWITGQTARDLLEQALKEK